MNTFDLTDRLHNKNTPRPLIGMMRQFRRPNQLVLAAAHAAKMLECDFFFFNPENINFDTERINALIYQNGNWVSQEVPFPDVVDNSPSKKENRAIYKELEKRVPITMRRIGNKNIISDRIIKEGVYNNIIIPYQTIQKVEDITNFLVKYNSSVIKPAGGNKGKNIYFIQQAEDTYIIKSKNIYKKLNGKELMEFLEDFTRKTYIIQPYIPSVTSEGIPFDIRIHVRRGKEAKWEVVKIYPRLGSGDGITSNLSQGGSIARLRPFLKRNFKTNWKTIEQNLKNLGKKFPVYFQKGYKKPIDALGLDIGLDDNGKLWLFEVNSFPGSSMFELEAQIPAMEYAKYLALKNIKGKSLNN